jgi:thioredoxin 1
MIIHLNRTNFKSEVLDSAIPVLVDFWADWCGPCHRLTPILEELAREVEGKAKIAKLDVDAEEAIADEYRIMSMPTLVVFDKGEIKDTMIGLKSKDALKRSLGL